MSWNVLWIMVDQHRADCLGCMGNPVVRTPNLDRLAAEGTLFENAFCQSPVCMASRASVFTGRYPEAVRIRGMGVLPPSETTFPEILQRNEYRTGAFGKVHLTPEKYTKQDLQSDVPILDWRRFAEEAAIWPIPPDPCKEDYGFQTHLGCDDACQGNFHAWLRREAPHLAERKPERFGEEAPGDLYVSPYPSEHHQSTYIASEAINFIRSQDADKPWFTFCSFIAPHHPFEAPADQIARYDGADIPLSSREIGVDMQDPPDRIAGAIGEMWRYSEAVQRRILLHYYASISLIDDCVGRLLDTLQETGQRDNTLVLFVSDHGEFVGGHGLLRKPSFHYDEVVRVPLILRYPNNTPGRNVSRLVELTDVYPTLLGLLGIPLNPGVQGMDWSAALGSGEPIGRPDIYSDMHDMDPMVCEKGGGPYTCCRTFRTERWKLNVYPTASFKSGQLFDLINDPAETTNLFHDPNYRDQREEMLWRMLQRVEANIDPLPLRLRQW